MAEEKNGLLKILNSYVYLAFSIKSDDTSEDTNLTVKDLLGNCSGESRYCNEVVYKYQLKIIDLLNSKENVVAVVPRGITLPWFMYASSNSLRVLAILPDSTYAKNVWEKAVFYSRVTDQRSAYIPLHDFSTTRNKFMFRTITFDEAENYSIEADLIVIYNIDRLPIKEQLDFIRKLRQKSNFRNAQFLVSLEKSSNYEAIANELSAKVVIGKIPYPTRNYYVIISKFEKLIKWYSSMVEELKKYNIYTLKDLTDNFAETYKKFKEEGNVRMLRKLRQIFLDESEIIQLIHNLRDGSSFPKGILIYFPTIVHAFLVSDILELSGSVNESNEITARDFNFVVKNRGALKNIKMSIHFGFPTTLSEFLDREMIEFTLGKKGGNDIFIIPYKYFPSWKRLDFWAKLARESLAHKGKIVQDEPKHLLKLNGVRVTKITDRELVENYQIGFVDLSRMAVVDEIKERDDKRVLVIERPLKLLKNECLKETFSGIKDLELVNSEVLVDAYFKDFGFTELFEFPRGVAIYYKGERRVINCGTKGIFNYNTYAYAFEVRDIDVGSSMAFFQALLAYKYLIRPDLIKFSYFGDLLKVWEKYPIGLLENIVKGTKQHSQLDISYEEIERAVDELSNNDDFISIYQDLYPHKMFNVKDVKALLRKLFRKKLDIHPSDTIKVPIYDEIKLYKNTYSAVILPDNTVEINKQREDAIRREDIEKMLKEKYNVDITPGDLLDDIPKLMVRLSIRQTENDLKQLFLLRGKAIQGMIDYLSRR